MNDSTQRPDDVTMNFGLLMESAQAHQKLAETQLERLQAHTRDIDGVVRDEIRRTLIDELQLLTAESQRAAQALQRIGRRANLRVGLCSVAVAIACAVIPVAIMRWMLPSDSEIDSLRTRRAALAANIAALERQGGLIDWRRCGESPRICVRVDRKSPTYGEKADYYVVAGY